ncbi:hypothetical protein LZ554_009262 [Drepanopeziza brunnea f. sp. 'monogermtubi']|nr:hypothetical protein LZ554_009262 [Drepanopeziza brunnea f. sp. 'monogermtubi']
MLVTNRAPISRQFAGATLLLLLIVLAGNFYIWAIGIERRVSSRTMAAGGASVNYPDQQQKQVAAATSTLQADPAEADSSPSTSAAASVPETEPESKPEAAKPSPTEFLPAFTIPSPTGIPSKFWYKAGPKGVNQDSQEWMDSCISQNPSYRREILADGSDDAYVQTNYAHRPDIVSLYTALPVPILKADFLRYLILFAEGGIWSDLDVSCNEIPIKDWLPEPFRKDAALVVGLEFSSEDWVFNGYLNAQFASWMIMAKPGSPHLAMVIQDVMHDLQESADKANVPISGLQMDMISDVVDVTGPKRMTRSVVKSMELQMGVPIDDRNVSGLRAPRLLGDVVILPDIAFAGSQSGFPEGHGPALVQHHYSGSWKNDHGGELPDDGEQTDDGEQKEDEEKKNDGKQKKDKEQKKDDEQKKEGGELARK